MLVEQIVELQLTGPGPPGLTCISITGYFYDKTKISKENLRVGFRLLLKCCTRQCTLLPLPRPNHVQINFNTKMQDVKRVLDLNKLRLLIATKRRIKQFNSFNWLLNVKNLVLLNGSKHVRNVIQWH